MIAILYTEMRTNARAIYPVMKKLSPHLPNHPPLLLRIPHRLIRSALLPLHTANDKIGAVDHTPISYPNRPVG